MHSVTCKLNKDARQHPNQSGMTFFVSLGEQSYNHKTKQKEWTNYEAALFAKDAQIAFYEDVLRAGSIVSVGCKGLLVETDPNGQYGPKLVMQEAFLASAYNTGAPAPQQQPQVQQQPYQPPEAQPYQQAPRQTPPAHQQQPAGFDQFADSIPF